MSRRPRTASAEGLEAIPGPELVFGLVGAVGTDLALVAEILATTLKKVGYASREIRVSALLHDLDAYANLANQLFNSEYDRIKLHMQAGTDLREKAKRGDILAWLTVGAVRNIREAEHTSRGVTDSDAKRGPLDRFAYIVRSIKHPAEIQTLRDVYGRAFFVISAYSPQDRRVDALAAKISESAGDPDARRFREKAEELIRIDEQENDNLGQSVRESFPLADVFVDARSTERVRAGIERFISGLFAEPFITPTRDEFAMFHAFAAAQRSADLGRQVGVVVTGGDGDIVAVGCNDVPKFGGGLYWTGDQPDHRDFRIGYDSSFKFRTQIAKQLVGRLIDAGWSAPREWSSSRENLAQELIARGTLKGTHISNLLEFGRAVHAEMASLSDAARRGVSVQGSSMYSTTFPCHLCARHIIAAGVERVVYIEPYPKSVAEELYEDSIVVDASDPVPGKVNFEPFEGIGPSLYTYMFKSGIRRDAHGKSIKWIPSESEPKLKRFVASYILIEDKVLGMLLPMKLEQLKIKPRNS